MNSTPRSPATAASLAAVWPAACLCVLGVTVLTGWATGTIQLARVLPGTTAMAINTAAMFLCCGLALLAPLVLPAATVAPAVRVLAAVLVAWPAAILSQAVFGTDLGIDWPAIHAALGDGHGKPGRMAPNACIGFVCAGAALWMSSAPARRARSRLRTVLAWLVLVIGIAGFVGYLLELEALYRIARFNQMAALTAIGMTLAGVGLVQADMAAAHARSARRQPWTAQRITWFAAALLALFALATSLTAFGLLKRSYESIASDNLLQAARQSSTGASALIEQAALLHRAVASRPALARAIRARLDGDDGAALRLEEQSALALGIESLVITAPDGTRLAQAGAMPLRAQARGLALQGGGGAWLLWRQGFVYRSEHPVFENGRALGTITLERSLVELTNFLDAAQKASATTDAVLCGRLDDSLFCFPSRFYAEPTVHELLDAAGKPRWPVARALNGESGALPVKGDARGVPVIAAYVPLPRERLGLVQKLETQELYAPLRDRLPLIVGAALLMIVACTVLLRRRVEPLLEQVLEERARMRSVLDGANDAFIAVDAEGRITHWNLQAERLLGHPAERAIGAPLASCLPGIDPALAQAARTGPDWNRSRRAEIVTRSAAGAEVPMEISIAPLDSGDGEAASIFARDLTLQKEAQRQLAQTQRQLLQAQKLDAIGKLTGGVAHDFNNLLQIIGANTSLLAREAGLGETGRRLLDACARAVDRGSRLAAQLLAFARRQPLQPVPLDANQRVQGMDDLLRRTLGERVQVETVLAGGLWTALADPHQLENVILNLAINARDAMPEGGKLTIETANVELDDAYSRLFDDVRPGQYVMVAVSDTGRGMPPDVLARAFEPFFTTKPEGKGTGLGLSMAYGFAKQSGGHIRIYSEAGQGTTIKVYLPRTLTTAAEAQSTPTGDAPVPGGHETILVVEDDAAVRACVLDMLRVLGYTTLEAGDAAQALQVLRSAPHVDLLFTDVVMPGPVRSPELAREARRLRPDIRVLFTSGYTQNAIVHGGRLDPGVELLSKPYSQDELGRRVRRLLDTRAGSPPPENASTEAGPGLAGIRLLFVEDEADLRTTTDELLGLLGVSVTSVATAEEAIQQMQERPFDVLVTDLSLPGMTGYQLADWVRRNAPAVRIAFATGYGHAVDAPPGVSVLPKPYGLAELEALLLSLGKSPAGATA